MAATEASDPNVPTYPYGAAIVETATKDTYLLSVTGDRDHDVSRKPVLNVTTSGGQVYPSLPQTGNLGGYNFLDDGGSVYVFAQYGNWTYFTNGSSVWRWSPVELLDKVVPYHPANQSSQQIYLTGMSGATLVTEHNGSLVYAGWKVPTYLPVDNVIDTNGDGIITTDDIGKDGFRLGPGNLSFQATPFTLCVSDTGMPRCINVLGCSQLPARTGITGMASVRGQLVVFTDREMFVLRGSLVTGQYSISKLSSYVGCVAHRTIALGTDGMLVWLAHDGFYSWDGSGLPQPIATDLDRIFYGDPNAVLPTKWTGLRAVDIAWPQVINTGLLPLASAQIHIMSGYYACALTIGPTQDHNNAVLCIDYRRNMSWLWVSQQPGRGADGTVIDDMGTAASTIHTMLVRSLDPQHFYAQGVQKNDGAGLTVDEQYTTAMLCQDGYTDERVRAIIYHRPKLMAFQCVLLTAPLWYGESTDKALRQLYFRMYADGIGVLPDGTTQYPQLAVLPEQTSLDNLSQAKPETSEQQFDLVPFAAQFVP